MREASLVLAAFAVLVDVAISKSEHIDRGEEAMAGDTSNEGMNAVCTTSKPPPFFTLAHLSHRQSQY